MSCHKGHIDEIDSFVFARPEVIEGLTTNSRKQEFRCVARHPRAARRDGGMRGCSGIGATGTCTANRGYRHGVRDRDNRQRSVAGMVAR